jgi:CBS domain containing-hemolysin-like protein
MIEYDNIFYIAISFGLVLLNGFFVMSEFSLVKLRTSQAKVLRFKKGIQGKILYQVHNKLDIYLSACQLGITLSSLGLGWVGEPAFSELLEPVFMSLGIGPVKFTKFIAFATGFVIISFMHIVIGELMPKSMAIRQTERLSLLTCIPLYVFYWAMFPFIWILNTTANLLLKLFRLDNVEHTEYGYGADEIKTILKSSHFKQPMRKESREMLLRMTEFSNLQAVDAMRPIKEMVSIDYSLSSHEKLEVVKKNLYTRYPVYLGKKSNIIGVIHTKDILCALGNDSQKDNLRSMLNVSHHDQLIDVLRKFQQGRPHFALVHKNNKPIGFITIDNMLTILIGKISDEFHLVKEPWVTLSKNKFIIKHDAPVYAIERLADVNLSEYPTDTVIDLLQYVLPDDITSKSIWEQPTFIVRPYSFKKGNLKEIVLEIKDIIED